MSMSLISPPVAPLFVVCPLMRALYARLPPPVAVPGARRALEPSGEVLGVIPPVFVLDARKRARPGFRLPNATEIITG